MKLERFIKNKKQKQILIGTIVGLVVLIGGITLYHTFALYENNKTYNVIKGKVPDFKKADIQLAITLDGKETDTIPEKEDGTNYLVNVTCDTGTGVWNYSKWQVEVSGFKKGTKCNVAFTKTDEEIPDINNGDIEIFAHGTSPQGSQYYTTNVTNLDVTKKYMFIVVPLCGTYSAPSVTSISDGGNYKKLTVNGVFPEQASSVFQVENATSIQFQTRELCNNSGVQTFYWIID